MTTFTFSVHEAPDGDAWHVPFEGNAAPKCLVNLDDFGFGSWGAHEVFVDWAKAERLDRRPGGLGQTVVRCSREQLRRFIDTCKQRRQFTADKSFEQVLDVAGAILVVLRVDEF